MEFPYVLYLTVAVICMIMAVASVVFIEKKDVDVGTMLGILLVSAIPVANFIVILGLIVTALTSYRNVVLFKARRH